MRRQRLNSTSVRSVGYDEFSQDLEVEFSSGKIYRYHDVPYGMYASLMRASSKGRFLNWRIKSVFPYTEVERKNQLSRRRQGATKTMSDELRRQL
jgi:hypothetical protein